ncbi:MAG: hypothetical protein ACRDQ7_12520 [Haloechinothrix sp.]
MAAHATELAARATELAAHVTEFAVAVAVRYGFESAAEGPRHSQV